MLPNTCTKDKILTLMDNLVLSFKFWKRVLEKKVVQNEICYTVNVCFRENFVKYI